MVVPYSLKGGVRGLSSSSVFESQTEVSHLRWDRGTEVRCSQAQVGSCAVSLLSSTSKQPKSNNEEPKSERNYLVLKRTWDRDAPPNGKAPLKTIVHVMASDTFKVISSKPRTFFLDLSNILVTKFVFDRISTDDGCDSSCKQVASGKSAVSVLEKTFERTEAVGQFSSALVSPSEAVNNGGLSNLPSCPAPHCLWPRQPKKIRTTGAVEGSAFQHVESPVHSAASNPHFPWPRKRKQALLTPEASPQENRADVIEIFQYARCTWPRNNAEETSEVSRPVSVLDDRCVEERVVHVPNGPRCAWPKDSRLTSSSIAYNHGSLTWSPDDPMSIPVLDSKVTPRCEWPRSTLKTTTSSVEDVVSPRCVWPRGRVSDPPLIATTQAPELKQGGEISTALESLNANSFITPSPSLLAFSVASKVHEFVQDSNSGPRCEWPRMRAFAKDEEPNGPRCSWPRQNTQALSFDDSLSPGVKNILISALPTSIVPVVGVIGYLSAREAGRVEPLNGQVAKKVGETVVGGARCAWPRMAPIAIVTNDSPRDLELGQSEVYDAHSEVLQGEVRYTWSRAPSAGPRMPLYAIDQLSTPRALPTAEAPQSDVVLGARCLWPRASVKQAYGQLENGAVLIKKFVARPAPHEQIEAIEGGPRCAWPRIAPLSPVQADTSVSNGGVVTRTALPDQIQVMDEGARCAWPRIAQLVPKAEDNVGICANAVAPITTIEPEVKVEVVEGGARCAWPRNAIAAPLVPLVEPTVVQDAEIVHILLNTDSAHMDVTLSPEKEFAISSSLPRRLLATSVCFSLMNHLLTLQGGSSLASPAELPGLLDKPPPAKIPEDTKRQFFFSAAKILLTNRK